MLEIYQFYICIFLCLFILVLLYVCYNMYKNKNIRKLTSNIYDKINKLQSDIKEIDSKEIFEKDDEVGVVYDTISEIIKDFDADTI